MNNIASPTLVVTILVALVAALGCNTAISLTDGGRLVHTAADAELPGGCNLIGDVAIGVPPDAARPPTADDLVLLMRNKASDLGANYIVVDSQEERGEAEKHWMGRARAYRCPAEAVNAAANAGTSGGDFGRVGPASGQTEDGSAEGTDVEDLEQTEEGEDTAGDDVDL